MIQKYIHINVSVNRHFKVLNIYRIDYLSSLPESQPTAADQTSKLKYVFRDARFFLIKSNNHENVALAKAKGVWSTPPQNEAKLNQAYKVSTITVPYILAY